MIPLFDLPETRPHPARYSDELLPHFAQILNAHDSRVILDPFAGTGKIHRLQTMCPAIAHIYAFELQPKWAAWHPDTRIGNATWLPILDNQIDAVVTSPAYGNRMADSFNATDEDGRNTYRHKYGAPLHRDNAGAMQWSDAYRCLHRRAWLESVRVLRPGGIFVLNIKDHFRAGKRQRVSLWHLLNLTRNRGLVLREHRQVVCPGNRHGANGERRMDYESIFVLQKL